MRKTIAIIFLLVHGLVAWADGSELFFRGVDALPPDERFRQLSLMLMITDGADEKLIDELSTALGEPEVKAAADFNFDDYTTPLIRIVDQKSMLAGATRLFRFTRDHAQGIAQRLQALKRERGESAEPFAVGAISEDAIIIRYAIADSMDFTVGPQAADTGKPPLSREYRARTLYLRNNLEYELFAADLERITREAIASVGGRTEAYERMFDDEVDAESIDKKIRAAEYAYGWDRDFDERAARMAQEILDNILEMEGTPDEQTP